MIRLLLTVVLSFGVAVSAADSPNLGRTSEGCHMFTKEAHVTIAGNIERASDQEIDALEICFINAYNDAAHKFCQHGSNEIHTAKIKSMSATTFSIVVDGQHCGRQLDSLFATNETILEEIDEDNPDRKLRPRVSDVAPYAKLCSAPKSGYFLVVLGNHTTATAGMQNIQFQNIHSFLAIIEVPYVESEAPSVSSAPSVSLTPSATLVPSVSCVPTKYDGELDACTVNATLEYASWVDEQVFGTGAPPRDSFNYTLDSCHPNATGLVLGNRAHGEYRFELHIHSVLFSWSKAQELRHSDVYNKLIRWGYEMRVVNASMVGNTGVEVPVVGIVSCNAGAEGRSQFMVTDEETRLRQEFLPFPEGCPNFIAETIPNVSVSCLGDKIVDDSACDNDLESKYHTDYNQLKDDYNMWKSKFDSIVREAKWRYNALVGIGFLWCIFHEERFGEPFVPCLEDEWNRACDEEEEVINEETVEHLRYGDARFKVNQLCRKSVDEVMDCTQCASCMLELKGAECCTESHCNENAVCGNNFCVNTLPDGATLIFVLGWFGDDVYELAVAGPASSSEKVVNSPTGVSENAVAIILDTTASPHGFYDYQVTLNFEKGEVTDPWTLYVFEDGAMSTVASGRGGEASTYEYGTRYPSLSPSVVPTHPPSFNPTVTAPSSIPSTSPPSPSPSESPSTLFPTAAPSTAAPSPKPTTRAPVATGPLPTQIPSQSVEPSQTTEPSFESASPPTSAASLLSHESRLRRPPSGLFSKEQVPPGDNLRLPLLDEANANNDTPDKTRE